MMSFMGRSGGFSQFLKVTAQTVPCQLSACPPYVPEEPEAALYVTPPARLTSQSLGKTNISGNVKVSSSFTGPAQVRYGHTDISPPDFSAYRRNECLDPTAKTRDSSVSRKTYSYVATAAVSMVGVVAAKEVVRMFISSLAPSADVLALASIEVKLSLIPEGTNTILKWRGKPLFVKHRTAEEIETARNVDISSLRDPQEDADRAERPEWLVLIGVCTHLGCVPIANAGDFGGYYCPCHGSHYDGSGRIRKGPAPLNLEVPPMSFLDDNTLVVG